MKTNKYCAWILAGVITCTAPAAVYAEDASAVIESIIENQLSSLLDDPEKVTDMIIYVKEQISQQEISDEQILDVIKMGEDNLNISLSDEERQSLLSMIKQIKNADIDDEEIRSSVNEIYNKLEDIGIDKEEVKTIFQKAAEFVKSILE